MTRDVFFAESMSVFSSSGQTARIDDLCADVLFLEQLGGAERHLDHAAGCYDRDVGAYAPHVRHAERNRVFLGRHRSLELVHHIVFEKDDKDGRPGSRSSSALWHRRASMASQPSIRACGRTRRAATASAAAADRRVAPMVARMT